MRPPLVKLGNKKRPPAHGRGLLSFLYASESGVIQPQAKPKRTANAHVSLAGTPA